MRINANGTTIVHLNDRGVSVHFKDGRSAKMLFDPRDPKMCAVARLWISAATTNGIDALVSVYPDGASFEVSLADAADATATLRVLDAFPSIRDPS